MDFEKPNGLHMHAESVEFFGVGVRDQGFLERVDSFDHYPPNLWNSSPYAWPFGDTKS